MNVRVHIFPTGDTREAVSFLQCTVSFYSITIVIGAENWETKHTQRDVPD